MYNIYSMIEYLTFDSPAFSLYVTAGVATYNLKTNVGMLGRNIWMDKNIDIFIDNSINPSRRYHENVIVVHVLILYFNYSSRILNLSFA